MDDEPKNNVIAMNRRVRRALDSNNPAALQLKVAHLEQQLVSMNQLVIALMLDRQDPDAPVPLKIEDLVMLNPKAIDVRIDRESGTVTVRLKGSLLV